LALNMGETKLMLRTNIGLPHIGAAHMKKHSRQSSRPS
jgi:hypothetical protein